MTSHLSNGLAVVTVVIGISAIGVMAYTHGYRGNVDNTYPVGLYRLNHQPTEHFHGEFVLFCPPVHTFIQEALDKDIISDGFCPGGVEPFTQQIVAMQGDRVDIRSDRIFVNNQEVPLTRTLEAPYEAKDS
ncbi:S26 family signal peptidase [Vibrio natriegens]|nr:S26 family signal peptidase [Vibrio natriegens]